MLHEYTNLVNLAANQMSPVESNAWTRFANVAMAAGEIELKGCQERELANQAGLLSE